MHFEVVGEIVDVETIAAPPIDSSRLSYRERQSRRWRRPPGDGERRRSVFYAPGMRNTRQSATSQTPV
jgi:hypothetical protein